MMNMAQMEERGLNPRVLEVEEGTLKQEDRWILSKANALVRDVTDNLERFEMGIAADKIYDFIWEEFCDWYIEMVKPRLYGEDVATKTAAIWTLREVLTIALKLLHPYMPFVTEEIFCTLKEAEGVLSQNESIMISEWPKYRQGRYCGADERGDQGYPQCAHGNECAARAQGDGLYCFGEQEGARYFCGGQGIFRAACLCE